MNRPDTRRASGRRTPAAGWATLLVAAALAAPLSAPLSAQDGVAPARSAEPVGPPSLDEMRITMDKWIETQQIISKEAKDWQQGQEILAGRLEIVKNEITTLEAKTKEAQASVVEADKKKTELLADNDKLKATVAQLTEAVAKMEGDVRRLFKMLPEPIQEKLRTLYDRIPADPAKTNVSFPERYQNVLGILNEVNRVNNEITVSYEVHELANGKPAEVQALYIGLGQAYYVSSGGEAGIGRPTPEGWVWEPSKAVAGDVLMALEILQGKQSPAFVPLPVKLQ